MRILIVCLTVALAGLTLPADAAVARSVEQAAPAPASPSARQTALARRYLDLLMPEQFGGVIHQMLGAEMAADSDMQGMPAEERRMIIDLTAELTTDMAPQMITQMVPVYAAAFTEEELAALVDFFETPMGRSIAAKSIELMPEANRAIMSVMPQLLEKMATRMCQHYGCTAEEQAAVLREMREGAGLAPASLEPAK